MSLLISTQAELLKTKRTASFWFSVIGAAFIPTILFIALNTDEKAAVRLAADPWGKFLAMGWQILSVFLLPMYVILVTTLITQIEFRNNTWKQVFSSPQSIGTIFFSKAITIHLMIIFCFLLFNLLLFASALLATLFNPALTFLERPVDWGLVLRLNAKIYLSILGISAIQYWLSLRFKNFVVPVGIGLALLISGIISLNLQWKHIAKHPYAFPAQTFDAIQKAGRPVIENHEWNSVGYFAVFVLIGLLDMRLRKEKG
ncbi:ABC transporter permease [Flavisolibacter sp. BT320]|nr:ABC transporter permease [Flavisolibacter longurius]